MAVKDNPERTTPRTSRQRRLFFGTNVLAMIVGAAVLLVLVNWTGQRRHFRRDVTSLASFGLSERSKKLIDSSSQPIRLTSIYTSKEPGKQRDKYLPRVEDLLDEYGLYTDKVETENVAGDDEKIELINRVQAKYAGASEGHAKVVKDAEELYKALSKTLEKKGEAFTQLIAAGGWLGRFPSFANIKGNFLQGLKEIEKVLGELEDLLGPSGLPRYSDATTKIKNTNNQIRKDLEASQKWFQEMGKLVEALGDPQAPFVLESKSKTAKLAELQGELVAAVGAPGDPVPDDPKPALKEFAQVAGKTSLFLRAEVSRIEQFAEKHPAITEQPRWRFQSRTGGVIALVTAIDLPDVLAMVEQDLSKRRDEIGAVLRQEQETHRLKAYLETVRQIVQMRAADLNKAAKALSTIFEDMRSVDPNSQQLLDQAKAEPPYAEQIEQLSDIGKRIEELPKLDLADIDRELEKPNVIVVETVKKDDDGSETGKVRVVSFDDVWPQADRVPRFDRNEDEVERIFNGDAAVSAAVLGLSYDKPFATVVIAYFEPEPDPRMRQMGARPQTGPIPSFRVTTLRKRLEEANFKVKNWNLAAEDKAPEPEEGTTNVYVFLPPAAAPPQYMRQPQAKQFGDKEIGLVQDVLADGGRGVFLANWQPPLAGPWGPMGPAQYGYDTMLRDQWGVEVKFTIRVIRGIRDPRDPNRFMLGLERWSYLRLNSFTDQPVGKPLKARRLMMTDVCPVEPIEKPPPGVTVESLLTVPGAPEYWGDRNPIQTISELKQTGRASKTDDDLRSPFSVAVSATKDNGQDKKRSKIVVLGNGISLVDGYLDQKVPRLGIKGQITFDPPPAANADLLVNALYWLVDREDLIASGPETLPQIGEVSDTGRAALWTVTILWALVPLIGGGAVLLVRRK